MALKLYRVEGEGCHHHEWISPESLDEYRKAFGGDPVEETDATILAEKEEERDQYRQPDQFGMRSPYGVRCPQHGLVCLSRKDYMTQMMAVDAKWQCPYCGGLASWSDEWHEGYLDAFGMEITYEGEVVRDG